MSCETSLYHIKCETLSDARFFRLFGGTGEQAALVIRPGKAFGLKKKQATHRGGKVNLVIFSIGSDCLSSALGYWHTS
jgi:hypothetical protein